MKHLFYGIACALSVGGSAHAANLDFFSLASGNEGNVNGQSFMAGDVSVDVFSSSTGGVADYAYLDDGAGLGVCQTVSCAGSSDDNVDRDGEYIQLNFSTAVTLSDFVFRNAAHPVITAEDGGTVRVQYRQDGPFISSDVGFTAIGALFDVTILRLRFDETPFYLSSVSVMPSEVPLPAALPMLLAGVAGLGFAGRRKRKQI